MIDTNTISCPLFFSFFFKKKDEDEEKRQTPETHLEQPKLQRKNMKLRKLITSQIVNDLLRLVIRHARERLAAAALGKAHATTELLLAAVAQQPDQGHVAEGGGHGVVPPSGEGERGEERRGIDGGQELR